MSLDRFLTTAAASLLGVGLLSTSAQATPTTYGGVFSGPVVYSSCTVPPPPGTHVAGGTWRVNLHDRKATARFVITVDGAPHVAFTAQLDRLASSPATFQAEVVTAAGPLVITLSGSAFSYVIAPYDYSAFGGAVCASVEYDGSLTSSP